MVDINKHRVMMLSLLKEIFSDVLLASKLGFKGGTALYFFYDLPRFSVDLDFNLLDINSYDAVKIRLKEMILKYGLIDTEADKANSYLIVLDYRMHQRKLKLEVNLRDFNDEYEIKSYMGIKMRVMKTSYLFAHKLCALTDRNMLANRDIFDCWFFFKNQFPIKAEIIQKRMENTIQEYLETCIQFLEKAPNRSLLNGLGELVDASQKNFIKTRLKDDLIQMMKIYQAFPIVE